MEYKMKFDVPGWLSTKHIGFINDKPTVLEGGFIRGCGYDDFMNRVGLEDLVNCSKYQENRVYGDEIQLDVERINLVKLEQLV